MVGLSSGADPAPPPRRYIDIANYASMRADTPRRGRSAAVSDGGDAGEVTAEEAAREDAALSALYDVVLPGEVTRESAGALCPPEGFVAP